MMGKRDAGFGLRPSSHMGRIVARG
jgi:hypothetical protein